MMKAVADNYQGYQKYQKFFIDAVVEHETISLKNRNDIYYNMYRDALKKAKEAKEVALSAYLEAKHIKNTYMLEDMEYESDLEEESITSMGEEIIEE